MTGDPETALSLNVPSTVRWSMDGKAVELLDQTLLPEEERYLRLESLDQVAEAIRALRVRGAPAIGIAAAFGLAMATRRRLESSREKGKSLARGELERGFKEDLARLTETRPTAVNLSWALDRLEVVFRGRWTQGPEAQVEGLIQEAEAILAEDRKMCRRIGEFGVQLLPPEGARVLTHCNAGALATGGMGTALAPLYVAWERGLSVRLFAGETRPLLQGGRLTAWEAHRVGIPTTVVTDSMVPALMAQGSVDLVLVGADRVAANGDVANKIGTYGVAVSAHHHGIPFYVALPRSTFDPRTPSGRDLPIEARDPSEIASFGGRRIVPEEVAVWTPAFDVTPAHLVTAFITDGGVLRPPFQVAIEGLLTQDSSPRDPRPFNGEEGP